MSDVLPDDDAPQRVLVRYTQNNKKDIPGVHTFDEHGGQQMAWTYKEHFEKLKSNGAPLILEDNNLESRIKAQMRRLSFRTTALAHNWVENPSVWLSDYRKQEEINQALRYAASTQPELELETLGESVLGREILGLSIAGKGALASKRLLIIGTQHAREWLSTMACMSLLRSWLDKRKGAVQDLPTLTVVPVVNPDGYAFSWDHDRLWRKNRRPSSVKDGRGGVDLNRNWGENWGDQHGASDFPEDDAYHGEHAFSEPETRAVRDFVNKKGDVAAMLDVHTFGQWVIYPASCQKPVSWGRTEFSELANQIASSITRSAGTEYSAIGGRSFPYPACGDAADWFAERQQAFAFTLELRPGPSSDHSGFIQPPSKIAPTSQDLIAAVEKLQAWVSHSPALGPTLAAQGARPPEEIEVESLCSMRAGPIDPSFSIGALCCLGALGRKRSFHTSAEPCSGSREKTKGKQ